MGSIRLLIRLVVLGSLGGLGVLAYYGFTLPVPRLLDPPAQPAVILETADGAVFAGRGVLTGRRLFGRGSPRPSHRRGDRHRGSPLPRP